MPKDLDLTELSPEVVEKKLEELKLNVKETPEEEEVDVDELEEDEEIEEDLEEEEEEEIEEKEEEKEEEVVEKKEEEKTKEEIEAEKIKEVVLSVVGKDAIAKVRGKELKIKDFSPEDMTTYLQKGFRADELMREAAQTKKQAESERTILSERTGDVDRILRQKEQPMEVQKVTIPKELNEEEFDNDQTKALKAIGRGLYEKVGTLEQATQEQTSTQQGQALLSEIKSHQEDYPIADTESVIVLKTLYPKAPVNEIMAEVHKNYSSKEHIEKIFKHCPDVKRHFIEQVEKAFLSKKQKAKRIPVKPAGGSTKVKSPEKIKFDSNFSFEDAEALSKTALGKLEESRKEEELE